MKWVEKKNYTVFGVILIDEFITNVTKFAILFFAFFFFFSIVGGYSKYFCFMCVKNFASSKSLNRHKIHSCPYSEKRATLLLCPYCTYTASRPDNVRAHIRTCLRRLEKGMMINNTNSNDFDYWQWAEGQVQRMEMLISFFFFFWVDL